MLSRCLMIFIIAEVVPGLGSLVFGRAFFALRNTPEVFDNRAKRPRSHVKRSKAEKHDFRLRDDHDNEYDRQDQKAERLTLDEFRILE